MKERTMKAPYESPEHIPKSERTYFQQLLVDVERHARGLSMDEILDWAGVLRSDLTANELETVELAFRRSHAKAAKESIDNMFLNMRKSKDSHIACMAYLSRHANKWEPNETDKVGSRNFKISFSD